MWNVKRLAGRVRFAVNSDSYQYEKWSGNSTYYLGADGHKRSFNLGRSEKSTDFDQIGWLSMRLRSEFRPARTIAQNIVSYLPRVAHTAVDKWYGKKT